MTFPSNPAEYEEYVSIMNEMAEQAIASTPDPEPQDFGGRCEDAPCCGCCGGEPYDSAMEYERQREDYSPESDELRQREEDDANLNDFDPEDRYLDSQWEDANEYGMEGCCGDF